MSQIDQMRKGTTILVILKLLVDLDRPLHGYGIIQRLEARSKGSFTFNEGLIYPTLHQLERRGFLESQWVGEPGTRRRKMYTITAKGRMRLEELLGEWDAFRAGMRLLLGREEPRSPDPLSQL
jgi:DNA-binding PadR family transcriptional regulator